MAIPQDPDSIAFSFPEPGPLLMCLLCLLASFTSHSDLLKKPLLIQADKLSFWYLQLQYTLMRHHHYFLIIVAMPLFNLPLFSYDPSKPLLENITLQVELTSRIGILGVNGCGKSTLLSVLTVCG